MAFRIQIRRDASLKWSTNNPVLLEGEFGYETDTGFIKIGDGVNPWNDLSYLLFGADSINIFSNGDFVTGAAGLNFIGSGVSVTGSNNLANISIPGGGSTGGAGGNKYAVRLDYNSSDAVVLQQVLTASPWTSSGLTVTINSNTDVRFRFANETAPPTSITGYFWKGELDKYVVHNYGQGTQGYAILSTALGSTVSGGIATNSFFTSFGSFELQFDVSLPNIGGSRKTTPPEFANAHGYFIFGF
jgi:hypothetical protein